MKMFFAYLILTFIPFIGISAPKGSDVIKQEYLSIIKQYDSVEGFDSYNIGKVAAWALRTAAKTSSSGDPTAKEVIKSAKDINGIIVLSFKKCSTSVRNTLSSRIDKTLSKEKLFHETKENGQTIKIYGTISNDGKTIKDISFYIPDESALFFLEGTLPLDTLTQLSKRK